MSRSTSERQDDKDAVMTTKGLTWLFVGGVTILLMVSITMSGVSEFILEAKEEKRSMKDLYWGFGIAVVYPITTNKLFGSFKRYSVFRSHFFPMLDEAIKLAIMSFPALTGMLNLSVVSILNIFYCISFVYNIGYCYLSNEDFKTYYDMFSSHEQSLDEEDLERGFNSITYGSIPKDELFKRLSVVTSNSGDTLVSKVSLPQTIPNSTLDDSLSHKKFVVGDDFEAGGRGKNSSSKMKRSQHDLIDKLYSVSPGNTYHLDAIAADAFQSSHVPGESPDSDYTSIENYTIINDISESYENIDDEVSTNRTHFGGGGGGNFKYTLPNGTKLKFGGGAGFDYKHSDDDGGDDGDDGGDDKTEKSSSNRKWLKWLIPSFSSNKKLKKLRLNSHAQYLQQRLSSYTLNSESEVSHPQVLSDTYHQRTESSPGCKGRYERFENFVLSYFDSPRNEIGFDVDYYFERYGILTNDVPYIMHLLEHENFALWALISNLALFTCFNIGFYWPLPFISLIILKLFESNFLASTLRSYKLVIICKFLLNLITLSGLVYVIVFQ